MAEHQFVQTFDPIRKLQYVNTDPSVMHCHHYAALFTKLAVDMRHLGAPAMLSESMEDAFYILLKKLVILEELTSAKERIEIFQEHFRLAGLGTLVLKNIQPSGGNAVITHSHLDEGWVKKWGTYDEPVNFMGQGYIAAAFAVIHNTFPRTYRVEETRSIVKGDPQSEFTVTKMGDEIQ
jgi:predicted hydrocarbon binding protein